MSIRHRPVWIIGSTYWRSWWNYPPPAKELIDALAPNYIYLTHIHWDHFQGPSLRKLGKETPVIIPRGPFDRMRRDLLDMGFKNIIELKHGETFAIADDFKLTSYHFSPFLDSAVVIEAEGVTMLNSNDAKLLGAPLDQVLARHPKIDFVFRSHSSANARLCFDVVDAPGAPIDDMEGYLRSFAKFTQRTGARYAVPFASNHCFLHKDTYAFNDTVQTPLIVETYFRDHGITSPELKVMVSGDAWSSESGFAITDNAERYFSDRPAMLDRYRNEKKDKLEKFYALESRSRIKKADVEKYVAKLWDAVPKLARRYFKGHPVTFVLTGDKRYVFEIDFHSGAVVERDEPRDTADGPLELHTSAFIMRQCMALDLFSHLSISKRVRYRVSKRTKRYIETLNLLFNLYEYDWLPVKRPLNAETVRALAGRWREGFVMVQLLRDVAVGRGISAERYL